MNRYSFAAGAVTALTVAAATWGVLHTIQTAKAAADGSLGIAMMSAVVSNLGVLVRGTGAVSVVRLDTGLYYVTFDRSTRDCSYFGSIGHNTSGASAQSAIISVNPGPSNQPNAVFVVTQLFNANAVDQYFHVQVMCWR